jgi:SulP family sulfate permease
MLLNAPNQKYLLLVGSGINFIDVAGVEMLINRARTMRAQGGDLFLSDINDQVRDMFERSGYAAQIGRDHLFHSKSHAIRHIVIHVLNRETCKMCRRGLFFELECLKQNPTFGRWNLGSIQDAASQPEKKSAIPA